MHCVTLYYLFTDRFFDPPIVWKLRRFFQLGFEARLTQDLTVLNDFVFKIVRDRKANKEQFENSNDLLSLFINDAAKRGEELSDVYLRDVIMNFMIAGRDTTASTLTYFFYTLSEFPECERKVLDEVHDVLRGSEPTHDLLKKLVYTECAINESIRLNPPVPGDLKVAVKDTTFPNGIIVPKGATVGYSPYLYSRLPTIWGPDACDYKPEVSSGYLKMDFHTCFVCFHY
jgi:cytochrome P450